jgi:RimJ/RimL family protein N-acetyltransferase
MDDFQGPAYRLETARLSMRCLAPRDTQSLSLAITESIEHLRPWLTWTAHEPLTPAQRLTWVRTQRGHFDLGSDYCFGAFAKDGTRLLGCGLLRLTTSVDERELGYWIHAGHLRQGLGTELVSALLRTAFDIEQLDAVELRTFPHNTACERLVRALGFSGPVLERLSYPLPDGSKSDLHAFGLSRAEYAVGPARQLPLEAYDALERRIL